MVKFPIRERRFRFAVFNVSERANAPCLWGNNPFMNGLIPLVTGVITPLGTVDNPMSQG